MKTIGDLLRRGGLKEDLIGVEVEVEGVNIMGDRYVNPIGWAYTHDGSLRGPESGEYVLSEPLPPGKAEQKVRDLYEIFEQYNTQIEESIRCGVHVHVNVCDLTVRELYNFITLAMVFEGVLAKYCGEHRVGNLFCLRSFDAQASKVVLEYVAKTHELKYFDTDEIRYCFFNPKAITQHGSLEFRAMRTTKDPEPILLWIEMLCKLKDYARVMESPVEVVEGTSGIGMLEYVEHVFGDLAKYLDFGDTLDLMIMGVRNAQDLAYSVDWFKEPESESSSPFHETWVRLNKPVKYPKELKFCEDAPDNVELKGPLKKIMVEL